MKQKRMQRSVTRPALKEVGLIDKRSGYTPGEKKLIRQEFKTLHEFLSSIGVHEVVYLSRVFWDASYGCQLFIGRESGWKIFEDPNMSRIILSRGLNSPPETPIRWTRPKVLVDKSHVKFYDVLYKHSRQNEISYRFDDTPGAASVFSICDAENKIGQERLFAAIGAAKVFHDILQKMLGEASRRRIGLTETEEKYLQLFFEGSSRADIAKQLNVSPNWVAKTFMSIRRKFDVKSDNAAIARAMDLKMLECGLAIPRKSD